ncbi:MAG: DUF512 domain-containing protein [Clostridia bacterium]|nr:DUF512 domain-containing protein [Clostridia bacterium]
MKTASKDQIIQTVYRTNTLPVISECNTSCVFCSHKQNPEEIETFRIPKMNLSEFKEIIEFLSGDRKIVIGESATRIVEGEPLLYPDILPLLALIRNRFRNTPIQITSNGLLLSEELVERLELLGNIEMNISLNSVDPSKRIRLLGKQAGTDIKKKIQLLKDRIPFSGSCVVVPEIIQQEDIEEMVEFLDQNHAQAVRVFLPGYTKMVNSRVCLRELYDEVCEAVRSLRRKYDIPVIIEPSLISNLECIVEGIIKNSPAYYAGLKTGDRITEVNGQIVRSRVEAFDSLYRQKDPTVRIQRENEEQDIKLSKKRNSSPGVIVLYDIDPDTLDKIENTVKRHEANTVVFVTSALAFPVMNSVFKLRELNFTHHLLCAENQFFGGTIQCAGLLTVSDIIECVRRYLREHTQPDLIMVPPVMFDYGKRDLLGRSIREIETALGVPVDTI